MPRISSREFERLPLRVHEFLSEVPLHDAWAIDLPWVRSGITLYEFWRTATEPPCMPPPLVRGLLKIRFSLGRLFDWDRAPTAPFTETFATRLTTADRSLSLVPPGTREGIFRVVYRFQNEQLLELTNRIAHAAALSALIETGDVYRFYFGVYVRNVSRFAPAYVTLIDPVRTFLVYPSLLRALRTNWNKTFGQHENKIAK